MGLQFRVGGRKAGGIKAKEIGPYAERDWHQYFVLQLCPWSIHVDQGECVCACVRACVCVMAHVSLSVPVAHKSEPPLRAPVTGARRVDTGAVRERSRCRREGPDGDGKPREMAEPISRHHGKTVNGCSMPRISMFHEFGLPSGLVES